MSISSLVVHTKPDKVEEIRAKFSALEGAEVHAVTEDGRLIVTVDQPVNMKATDVLTEIQNTEGVLSSSLIFNYFEENVDPGEGDLPDTLGKEEAHDVIQA